MTDRLLKFLDFESDDLLSAFKKASVSGEGTPQEVSDFRENYFNSFIARYFPFPHRVTKGCIDDSYGKRSDSVDCIVINPCHPYTIDSKEKFSLILADGVDLAIELKPDVQSKAELHRGLEQSRTVKRLRRVKEPLTKVSRPSEQIVEHSKSVPSFIFSIKANSNPLDTLKNVIAYYSENHIPPEEQVDYIVINDTGIIANYKYPELSYAQDKRTGLFFEKWEEKTLAAFLLYLNRIFPAQLRLTAPILPYYLSGLTPEGTYEVAL